MSLLSVVVPAYNEQDIIPKTASAISEILTAAQIDFEILFVKVRHWCSRSPAV